MEKMVSFFSSLSIFKTYLLVSHLIVFNDYVNIKTEYTDIYISMHLSEHINSVL